ncbi:MAG TPA: hypothetical protein VHX44_09975, partial [Planctomycetota bacterium]|nr:hypothetical protein [Planctomycetota bacterium]
QQSAQSSSNSLSRYAQPWMPMQKADRRAASGATSAEAASHRPIVGNIPAKYLPSDPKLALHARTHPTRGAPTTPLAPWPQTALQARISSVRCNHSQRR